MKDFIALYLFAVVGISPCLASSAWRIYDNSNSSLTSNKIMALAVDRNNDVWVGPWEGGIAKVSYSNDSLYRYDNSNALAGYVLSIAIDESGAKWIGQNSLGSEALSKYDSSGWMLFSSGNAPTYSIFEIVPDLSPTLWICAASGFFKFDGMSWTEYNVPSKPSTSYRCMVIDKDQKKWIGTFAVGGPFTLFALGLQSFDNANWVSYDTTNSGLPANNIGAIAIDKNGSKWIGTRRMDWSGLEGGGLAVFNDTTWVVYNASNSGLPSNSINAIAVDSSGQKWIGTDKSLVLFNDTSWVVFDTSNSGLPDNFINAIVVDKTGDVWVGTNKGLAVYSGFSEGHIRPRINSQHQNVSAEVFPNPFNNFMSIKWTGMGLDENISSKIIDCQGRTVSNLGRIIHPLIWDGRDNRGRLVPAGNYIVSVNAGENVFKKKVTLLR